MYCVVKKDGNLVAIWVRGRTTLAIDRELGGVNWFGSVGETEVEAIAEALKAGFAG
jgi:hypothetical protein